MEFEVNLTGNLEEEAHAGAAAMLEGDAAAKGLTASLSALGGAASALQASTRAAEGLVAALREAKAAGPAFSASTDNDFKRSKWETPPKAEKPEKKGAAEGLAKAGKDGASLGKAGAAAFDSTASMLGKATAGLVAYGAAMSGLHSLSDLTTMAIGWRTMGQLQLLSWRATMDLRRAVQGVDAQPLVRAFTRLESNLSKSTVTGSALSGILTRGFSAAFSTFERLTPMLEGLFQGAIEGALDLEISWIKLKTAAIPLTVALSGILTPANAANASAAAGAAPFQILAASVTTVAEALRAVTAAYGGASKALDAISQGLGAATGTGAASSLGGRLGAASGQGPAAGAQIGTSIKGALGATINPLGALWDGIADAGKAFAGPAGESTGLALGLGLVSGLGAAEAGVRAAGGRLGSAGNEGARAAVGAHSPADATIALGRDMGAGLVIGQDQSRGAVEAAGARMADGAAGGAAAGGKGGGAPGAGADISITVGQIGPFSVEAKSGSVEDLRAAILALAPTIGHELFRLALLQAGLAPPGTT